VLAPRPHIRIAFIVTLSGYGDGFGDDRPLTSRTISNVKMDRPKEG
jgi:hypothetical protein